MHKLMFKTKRPSIVKAALTLEGINLKKVTRLHEGIRGGGSIGPLASTFDTIYPIEA